MTHSAFTSYLHALQQKLATGDATERSHYGTLEILLAAFDPDCVIVNEPRRIACGTPDFIISRGQAPVGYVEAKDVGANLDAAERSEQMDRYLDSLNNLILTDYLEFRWFVEGEHRETVSLGTLTRDDEIRKAEGGARKVADLLSKFYAQEVPTIGRPEELAARMASLARLIRRLIEETFQQERGAGALHAQMEAFRQTLMPDLDPSQFADMYAQTITYGLFAARVHMENGAGFTRQDAWTNLPATNPFLRDFFNRIAGPGLDERIAWLVDDLAHLLARADMTEVLHDFGRRIRQEDPVVHFYETFLKAYDPQMRQTRGVYYTPEPVVSYIVRSLDHILQTRFDRSMGLAEKNVLILDPAVGTATFLYFVVQEIYRKLDAMGLTGAWNDYVKNHLLSRLFGFELLMAPYTVAHMKLGMQLQEMGYAFESDRRLGIYLTNSLEEPVTEAETLGFAGFIAQEANRAAEVKRDEPIMVVLGNPPYSVSSANQGDYIEELMDRYKEAVRDERNIQPLSDDYIKFIRFAHDRIERTGHGVIGMITNHSYLSGLIHRGMREELMRTFDEIYVLNLHGNALMGETAPDGSADENVFDIRQGVAIGLFIKRSPSPRETSKVSETSEVYYADLWGCREHKYDALSENDVATLEWEPLEPVAPHYFFVPKDFNRLSEYEEGWSVPNIFPEGSRGIETGKDEHLVAFSVQDIREVMQTIANPSVSNEQLEQTYDIRETSGWPVDRLRADLMEVGFEAERIISLLHRPFDWRYTYFSDFLRRTHSRVTGQMLCKNLAILAIRQVVGSDHFSHIGVSSCVTDNRVFYSNRSAPAMYPLYLYPDDEAETLFDDTATSPWPPDPEHGHRVPNLSKSFVREFAEKLGLAFDAHKTGKSTPDDTFSPRDVLAYAYAVFHSPTYRQRYAEFLKIDFPRLPLTSDRDLFWRLVEKGEALMALHLMESPLLERTSVRFPKGDSNLVASRHPRYLAPGEPHPETGEPLAEGRVYINETQYFAGIDPQVWKFEIGGYQVLEKWLRDRKRADYPLSFDDVRHYQRIVVALEETMRLMEEIDALIDAHGGWPIM